MTLAPLTRRQRELLDFIDLFIQQHGWSPSLDEMRAQFDLTISTVHKHLTNMQEKGYIRRAWNRARSVEILSTGTPCPHCGQPLPSSRGPARSEMAVVTVGDVDVV